MVMDGQETRDERHPSAPRRILFACAALFAFFALAPAALASTASLVGTTLTVTGSPGETNVLNIRYDPTPNPDAWLITDTPAMTPGAGCVANGNDVRCDDDAPVTVTKLIVNLGDGNDSVSLDSLGADAVPASVAPSLNGEAGNDTLTDGVGDGILNGGPDDDTLNGSTGSNTASFAGGAPVVVNLGFPFDGNASGQGTDNIDFSINNALGSGGNDELNGSSQPNVLSGGGGNDLFRGLGGNDELHGDAGNDDLDGGSDADDYDGGTGTDLANYSLRNNPTDPLTITAGDGQPNDGGQALDLDSGRLDDVQGTIENVTAGNTPDKITGNTLANVLTGGGGNDTIDGQAGNDTVHGGDDNDTVTGLGGADNLLGDDGDDSITGGKGVDSFLGGLGNDALFAKDKRRDKVINCEDGDDALESAVRDKKAPKRLPKRKRRRRIDPKAISC